MGLQYGAFGFNDNLSFCFDPANPKSISTAGTSIADIMGVGNGTMVNTCNWAPNNNGCLICDGSTGFTTFPSHNNFDFGTGDFTIELFVYLTSTSDISIFCQNDIPTASTTDKWWLGYSSNTLRFGRHASTDSAYASWTPSTHTWYHVAVTRISGIIALYVNGTPLSVTNSTIFNNVSLSQNGFSVGAGSLGSYLLPFTSPEQAQTYGALAGTFYFKSSGMSVPLSMEFQPRYIDGYPYVCVFRSPYNSTATTNLLGNLIPMKGLLVQRDTLDYRAAVYWNNASTYSQTSGNTADSGYAYRKVMLGYGGGHGIYNTSQNVCSWSDSTGAIGAGYNGSSCGSYPNGLLWGTGVSGATYANLSGTWSHWVYWTG